MRQIAWTRLSGDAIEEMLAIMLLREHPHGRHVKANPGDGGIDVFVPLDPGSPLGLNYQIKKFAEKIGDSQQDQVRRSLRRTQKTAESGQFVTTKCFVVVPLLPTAEDYKWLDGFAEELTFPVEWFGLSHVEGLVAKYPEVVEYCSDAGQRAYYDGLHTNMIAMVRSKLDLPSGDVEIEPVDVVSHIAALDKVVNRDPLYSYHIRTSPTHPSFSTESGAVATFTQQFDSNLFVAIDIHPRFADAVKMRPCLLRVTPVPANDEERVELEEFRRFGTPVTVTAHVAVDFPGGLGDRLENATISLMPAPVGDKGPKYDYEILTPDGSVASRCLMEVVQVSRGSQENNYLIKLADAKRVFEMVWRFDSTGKSTSLRITWLNLVGRLAAEVVESVQFLASIKEGHVLRMAEQYRPRTAKLYPLDGLSGKAERWQQAHKLISALANIQRIADRDVIVPDPSLMVGETASDILMCGRLACGEVVYGNWEGLETEAGPDFDAGLFREPAPIRASGIYELVIGDESYNLGEVELAHDSMGAEFDTQPDSGQQIVRLVATNDTPSRMRMAVHASNE